VQLLFFSVVSFLKKRVPQLEVKWKAMLCKLTRCVDRAQYFDALWLGLWVLKILTCSCIINKNKSYFLKK
jgi:hypothetical protein